MRAAICILLVVGLFSCGEKADVVTPVLGPTNAHFRGNKIGDDYQQVLKKANVDKAVPVEEGVLSCEFQVDGANLLVKYEFDLEKLYSIQADIFFPDSTALRSFEEAVVSRYNSSYGKVGLDGGFMVWTDNSSGTEVEFTLADESIEFGQPKLSLTIYNFDY